VDKIITSYYSRREDIIRIYTELITCLCAYGDHIICKRTMPIA